MIDYFSEGLKNIGVSATILEIAQKLNLSPVAGSFFGENSSNCLVISYMR